jgi:hypothetical protein
MEFRLFRTHDAINDDIILIRGRHGRNDYLVRYTDGTKPTTVWVNEKTRDEVLEYIYSTLYFAMHDNDPFKSIQVAIPGRPLFVLTIPNLNENSIEDIVRASELYLDNPGTLFTQ